MKNIFFALRAISYEGTQTCDRFTKNVESADRFTKNVDVDVDVERRVLVPRPLLVSGSPFLPPLSKRVSLLKIRFSRPPAETKKKLDFFRIFFSVFFNFPQENTVSWKFYDFPKTPRRYTNFLKIKILRQNAKNFLRASRDKLWRYTNLWPIYKERRIRWPIYKQCRRR